MWGLIEKHFKKLGLIVDELEVSRAKKVEISNKLQKK